MPYARRYMPRGIQNKTEAKYAAYLEELKAKGEIIDYAYEVETLKLGQDCRYTPDFRVMRNVVTRGAYFDTVDPIIEFHEVKGSKAKGSKPYIEDDALVKIKCAATLHPYKFIIAWWNKDHWERREIN